MKEKKHSYQNEVRAVWKPYHHKIKPVVKHFDEAIKFCAIKHNPLIADTNSFFEKVEDEFNRALADLEGRNITDIEKSKFTRIACGQNKGETIYFWKNRPIITFGRLRTGKQEQWFFYKTYLESR